MNARITHALVAALAAVSLATAGCAQPTAATQAESIEFQTQELTATIMRDDSAKHSWRKIAAAQTTEEKAVAVIRALLGAA